MTCPVCGEKLRPNKGWAAMFYDGYCNTCDMPVDNVDEDENDVLQPLCVPVLPVHRRG